MLKVSAGLIVFGNKPAHFLDRLIGHCHCSAMADFAGNKISFPQTLRISYRVNPWPRPELSRAYFDNSD
jgi:hypothetical protein